MKTKRLSIAKFGEKDFADYYKLASNKEVMKWITGKAISKWSAKKKFKTIMEVNALESDFGAFSIQISANNVFIGSGKIVMTNDYEAEIGYSVLPQYWRMGYGTEIAEALVRYAQQFEHIKSLIAIIDHKNKASQRILEKCNFKLHHACTMDNLFVEIYQLCLMG